MPNKKDKDKKLSFTEKFTNFTPKLSLDLARRSLGLLVNEWNEDIEAVLTTCCRDPNLLFPTNNINSKVTSLQEYLDKWVKRYRQAYANRPSLRKSGKVGTVPDPIINTIIETRLDELMTSEEAAAIVSGHRLAMSAENIVGAILEEYLAERLKPFGWYCAWGETIRIVDFCSKNGDLLQVKNRDNTENSASGAIRDGTEIQKWFRGKSKSGKTNWESLKVITGCDRLSEDDFTEFVRELLRKNPDVLFVEDAIQKLHRQDRRTDN